MASVKFVQSQKKVLPILCGAFDDKRESVVKHIIHVLREAYDLEVAAQDPLTFEPIKIYVKVITDNACQKEMGGVKSMLSKCADTYHDDPTKSFQTIVEGKSPVNHV